jgi:hypothetical protein
MDYAKKKEMADRLLQKDGSLITLTRYESTSLWVKSYDPVEMCDKWTKAATETTPEEVTYTAPTGTPTTYQKYGIRTEFKLSEIDGTVIQLGDVRLVLSTDFPEPQEGDKFTVDSVVYNYVNHEVKAPAITEIIYIVQVRK